MKKVFLIHGFEGNPNGGWRPWLMGELSKKNIYACALPMPNPYNPVLKEWLEELGRNVEKNSNDKIYLVGHSLGGTIILRYLEKYKGKNIKGIILVSAPCHNSKRILVKIEKFLKKPFKWNTIADKVSKVAVIQGSNDPYVPMSDAEEISKALNGELILIPNGKHLNGSAGFFQLPECLSALSKMIA